MNDVLGEDWMCQHETTGHRLPLPAPDSQGRRLHLIPCCLTDAQVVDLLAVVRRAQMGPVVA